MRISDWSSDVCSSDLELALGGTPVLLVNPRAPLATGPVFAAWDGIDRGPLFTGADLRAQLFAARNDLQRPAIAGCPAIADVLIELGEIGRAHVGTPVTNAHLVCRLLRDKKTTNPINTLRR